MEQLYHTLFPQGSGTIMEEGVEKLRNLEAGKN